MTEEIEMNKSEVCLTSRIKKTIPYWILAFTLGSLGACGSSGSGGSSVQHSEKIYVIGEISGTLANEIGKIFVRTVDYDGVAADAPIFLAADRVESLDDTMRIGIIHAYRNGYPVVVIHGGAA
jgi:hypothetical protein